MVDAQPNAALEFLKSRVAATPWGTVAGLNQLPFVLFDAVAGVMREYADSQKTCDFGPELKSFKYRVRSNTPHPSHVWNDDIAKCCIRCEAFYGHPTSLLACDPSKLAGKVEPCCECGADYPRSDLIVGHI